MPVLPNIFDWKSVVHSATSVDLPDVALVYEPLILECWMKSAKAWQAGSKDFSVWGEFEPVAATERFLLPFRNEPPFRRFAEVCIARLLEQQGFKCWGGVQCFDYARPAGKGKGRALLNTEEARACADWCWPSEIQHTLDFQPRNPDIVGHRETDKQWVFCEATRKGEHVGQEQLQGLAVLHLLSGAPAAIVEVTETVRPPRLRTATLSYRPDASLDWNNIVRAPKAFFMRLSASREAASRLP